MNWTGGKLSCHSKVTTGKDLIQRQKAHFAKVRTKLHDEIASCNEPVAQHNSRTASDKDTDRRRVYYEPRQDGSVGVVHRSSADNEVNIEERITDIHFHNMSRHNSSAQVHLTKISGKQNLIDTSNITRQVRKTEHTRERLLIEAQKTRLLNRKDWLGLTSIQPKPIQLNDGNNREGLAKRRRLHGKSQSRLRPLTYHSLSQDKHDTFVHESLLKVDELHIRIGSQTYVPTTESSDTPGSDIFGSMSEHSHGSIERTHGSQYLYQHHPTPVVSRVSRTALESVYWTRSGQSRGFETTTDTQYELQDPMRDNNGQGLSPRCDNGFGKREAAVGVSSHPQLVTLHHANKQNIVDMNLSGIVKPSKDGDPNDISLPRFYAGPDSLKDYNLHALQQASPIEDKVTNTVAECNDGKSDTPSDNRGWQYLLGFDRDRQRSSYVPGKAPCPGENQALPTQQEHTQSSSMASRISDSLSDCSNAHFDCSTPPKHKQLSGIYRTRSADLLFQDRFQPEREASDMWKSFIFGAGVGGIPSADGRGLGLETSTRPTSDLEV